MSGFPSHHIDEDLLIAYGAGSLTGAKALMVATHLALCPLCRDAVRDAEAAAAALFVELSEPVALEGRRPESSAAWLRAHDGVPLDGAGLAQACPVPQPLRSVLGAPLSDLPWRNIWFGVKELSVPADHVGEAFTLLQIPSGRRMPQHDHEGDEWTMVLSGAYTDSTGRYATGDVQRGQPGLDHQPHAEPIGPCLCLVVVDAPLRLTGMLGRAAALPRALGFWR